VSTTYAGSDMLSEGFSIGGVRQHVYSQTACLVQQMAYHNELLMLILRLSINKDNDIETQYQ